MLRVLAVKGSRSPRYQDRPTEPALFAGAPTRRIEGGERDVLDAYWTPVACAAACCELIAEAGGPVGWTTEIAPRTILEPSVGGGAWVLGARRVWPRAAVDRIDLDAEAPGLALDLRRGERWWACDFVSTGVSDHPWDMIVGNPPYGGDITEWLDLSLARAGVVAYLLRSTVLGSLERVRWWAAHPPALVATLAPRPRWQGPGARSESDTCDSVLVLWVRGEIDTRHRWLHWRPA